MFLFYKDLKSSQYDTNDTKDTLQFVLMFYLKSTSVKRTMSKPRQISRKDTYILNRQEMTTLNFPSVQLCSKIGYMGNILPRITCNKKVLTDNSIKHINHYQLGHLYNYVNLLD